MIIHNVRESLSFKNPIVAMGIFDGVHCGHTSLLNSLIDKAKKSSGESVVITFTYPQSQNFCLTTPDEKRKVLCKMGIDHLIEIELNEEFKKMSPVDFIKNILVDKINAKHIIVGYDQRFGQGGEGNIETLQQYSSAFGYTVEQAPEFRPEGNKVSSSTIREALLAGGVDNANSLLGYNYTIAGTVIEGKKIGKGIGFPTANILPDITKLIPAGGVYAVGVNTKFGFFPGMLSIGVNPTIDPANRKISIEVNIINFDRDIYNENISVIFRKRLRDEKRFENIEQLVSQMKLDREETLRLFEM
jgi:riboflavin kinase/FMN adenylyltransferase